MCDSRHFAVRFPEKARSSSTFHNCSSAADAKLANSRVVASLPTASSNCSCSSTGGRKITAVFTLDTVRWNVNIAFSLLGQLKPALHVSNSIDRRFFPSLRIRQWIAERFKEDGRKNTLGIGIRLDAQTTQAVRSVKNLYNASLLGER